MQIRGGAHWKHESLNPGVDILNVDGSEIWHANQQVSSACIPCLNTVGFCSAASGRID